MKKKLLWGSLILVIIYSSLWFFASKIVERKAYRYLDQLQKNKVLSEYSGNISITGFPFSFNINLAHPRLKFQKSDTKYNASCDMLFDGDLSVNLALFSNDIRLETLGDLHLKGNLNSYNFNYTISGKNSYYQVQLVNSLILSAIKGSIGASGETARAILLGLVEEINIHNENLSVMNKLSNKLLVYAKETDFKINLEGDDNKLKARYRETLEDAEFDREFKTLTSQMLTLPFIRDAVNNIDLNVRNYFDVFSFDRLGKITHKIDLNLKMENGSTTININKLQLNDAAYKLNASGNIITGKMDKLDMKFEAKLSDQWYALSKVYANRLQLQGFGSPEFGESSNSIVFNLFSSIFGFFTDLFRVNTDHATYVPKLNDLGTINGDINCNYRSAGKGFEMNMKKVKITTDKFAIDASGSASNPGAGSAGDKYNLKAKLTNYVYIVDSIVNYVNRVEHSVGRSFFMIFGRRLAISKNISDRIKFFIRRVSDDPSSDSNSLNLTIENKDGGKCPAVGRYSSSEFCRIWNSFIFNILLGEVVGNLNPAEMSRRLLAGPGQIVTNLPGSVGKLPKAAGSIVTGILGGLFGSNSTRNEE